MFCRKCPHKKAQKDLINLGLSFVSRCCADSYSFCNWINSTISTSTCSHSCVVLLEKSLLNSCSSCSHPVENRGNCCASLDSCSHLLFCLPSECLVKGFKICLCNLQSTDKLSKTQIKKRIFRRSCVNNFRSLAGLN